MFEFQRLAKEDYELMGRCFSWTTEDARVLLTSFEMEVSGVFGDSQELYEFDRRANLETLEGLDKVFHKTWGKWFEFLWKYMESGDLPYANALKKGELNDPADPGATVDEYMCRCNIVPSELLECISKAVGAGELTFDLKTFQGFLAGHASAPERYVRVVKQPMDKKDMAAALASGRNESSKDEIREYIASQWAEGCTCWHNVMREHVCSHFLDVTAGEKKEKVLGLSMQVLLKTIREFYIASGKEEWIYDKAKHGGEKNRCLLHFPAND